MCKDISIISNSEYLKEFFYGVTCFMLKYDVRGEI